LTFAIKLIVLAAALLPAARADSLEAILARMDRAAKEFKSVSATLKQSDYTAVIQDLSPPETGQLRIKRGKNGVNAILEFTDPERRTVFISGHKVDIYHPKAKMAEEYNLTNYMGTIDQFLLLAFGTSGADLRKNYDVRLGGAETIDKTPTTRIELRPRTDEVKKVVTKIELWIPDGQSNAIREKVTEPSDNYYLADYSNVKRDVNIPDSVFDFKPPKGVSVKYPQR
jgi:outer membrane lipoprotein-sorting protein